MGFRRREMWPKREELSMEEPGAKRDLAAAMFKLMLSVNPVNFLTLEDPSPKFSRKDFSNLYHLKIPYQTLILNYTASTTR